MAWESPVNLLGGRAAGGFGGEIAPYPLQPVCVRGAVDAACSARHALGYDLGQRPTLAQPAADQPVDNGLDLPFLEGAADPHRVIARRQPTTNRR